MIIEDGTGKGKIAKVSENNRLYTNSLSIPEVSDLSERLGTTFILGSNFQTITTADTHYGFIYMKNTSTTKNIYIDKIRTCGTSPTRWRVWKNPTTGTIIDSGTAITATPANFAKVTTLEATILLGGEGKTVTDGSVLATWINNGPGHSVEQFHGSLILEPNNSIILTTYVTTSTTDVCTTWQFYVK